MNSSMLTADRTTHWKVLSVAALAIAGVAGIIGANAGDRTSDRHPVVQATKLHHLSTDPRGPQLIAMSE